MSNLSRAILIATFLSILTIPTHRVAAQAQPRYTLIDLGTFGGPNSYLDLPGQPMNVQGTVIFDAGVATPDPYAPNCLNPDCFVSQGGEWRNGVLTKLDSLPGGISNAPFSISAAGMIAGLSQNGVIDPVSGQPESRAVLWKDGKVRDLGTLPGGNQSAAFVMNDHGLVTGPATNAIPDPYSSQFFLGWGNETRGFVWKNGVMSDMGTLGGPDTLPVFMNNRGQISGQSYTNSTPNAATQQPTMDPFLWENGVMKDLGTLGGTLGFPNAMNSRGEVVGQSNRAGDQSFHPFLWNGHSMQDLGTLGGADGYATWINETGDVIGDAQIPVGCDACNEPEVHHAFFWSKGAMTDLGTVLGDRCSTSWGINDRDQVVGASGICHGGVHAFLWENGAMVDLNTLIAPGSQLQLTEAQYINNRGEIVSFATLPNGNQHIVLLIPTHRYTAADTSVTPVGSAGSQASFTVRFDSTAVGQGQVLFGSGPGCAGLVETATQDQGTGTTTHTIQVQGNDMPGTVGDNGIIPGATYWYEVVTNTCSGREIDDNSGKCYSVTIPTS